MIRKAEISVEFFPPKNEEGAIQILNTAQKIKNLELDFASITYGAGGSSREHTIEYTKKLKDILACKIMPHLTCIGHSKEEIVDILDMYKSMGITKIMALRGDLPKNVADCKTSHFKYASDLVSFIKTEYPQFKIYAACYPESHSQAKSLEEDIANLKTKVDAGVDCLITQLFFDNAKFYEFVDKCRNVGIDKEFIAGLLPALSLKQAENFCNTVQVGLPQELHKQLSQAETAEDARLVGMNWTIKQMENLIENSFFKTHLYILNRAKSVMGILDRREFL
ncbi:MAG: methylenetetrahydrofolate reductase [NAD(P)H] [Opitutales bacterium]